MLALGPFGELSWNTHTAPIDVEASFLLSPKVRDLPDLEDLQDIRLGLLGRKLFWLVLAGALAGAVVAEGSRRRRLATAGIGAASAAGLFALVMGLSILTFDARALNEPRYRGPIKDVPRVLRLLKEVQRDWTGVRRNINKMVAGLERIHAQIVAAGTEPTPAPTVKFLVVSDLHNNPLGLLLAKELVRRFDADAVLNAGDFTDRGTAPEGELFARFADLGVPQVIVGGNHEDVATLQRVERIPGVVVLESREGRDVREIGGVTVLGDTDPNAYFIGSDPSNDVAEEQIPLLCERLRDRLFATGADVVLVHDPRMGTCAADAAKEAARPLAFVWGHLHRQAFEREGAVVSVSPGTSGANGLKTPRAAAYGFALLEFEPGTSEMTSACLFLFDSPSELRETSCHIRPQDTGSLAPAP